MRRKLNRKLSIAAIIIASAVVFTSCAPAGQNKVQLRVYMADSLMIPFQTIEKQFELKYPGVDVLIEGHGSIQVIRAVTELGDDVDLAAVADSQLIRLLMYDTQMPDKNGPYADWCIDFATNAIGIAYTDNSRYAKEIKADNWYQIMSRPDVNIGFSDPRIDSLGYRTLMVAQLARAYYKDDALFDRLLAGNFSPVIGITTSQGITVIKVPEMLRPALPRVILRSYSLQILALLESGDVDYSFEYESVARQHGLNFLKLPDEINLSSQNYTQLYRQVKVEMDFQRFASVNPKFNGAPIVYGVTIPNNALHPEVATTFLEFLLGQGGQSILRENYQPPLVPAVSDNPAKVPDILRGLIQ